MLACQKKESYEQKLKLLERQKELELKMEKEKSYLELVEAQSNLKLAEI